MRTNVRDTLDFRLDYVTSKHFWKFLKSVCEMNAFNAVYGVISAIAATFILFSSIPSVILGQNHRIDTALLFYLFIVLFIWGMLSAGIYFFIKLSFARMDRLSNYIYQSEEKIIKEVKHRLPNLFYINKEELESMMGINTDILVSNSAFLVILSLVFSFIMTMWLSSENQIDILGFSCLLIITSLSIFYFFKKIVMIVLKKHVLKFFIVEHSSKN